MIITVIGGSGSGKSEYAEDTVLHISNGKKIYLATMKPEGSEAQDRIQKHKEQRKGKGFLTKECLDGLDITLNELKQEIRNYIGKSTILLECVSNLVANEMFQEKWNISDVEKSNMSEITEFWEKCETESYHKLKGEIRELAELSENLVIVSNNVFDDGMEYEEGTRAYIRLIGRLNAYLSQISDQVIEVVFSRPIRWK